MKIIFCTLFFLLNISLYSQSEELEDLIVGNWEDGSTVSATLNRTSETLEVQTNINGVESIAQYNSYDTILFFDCERVIGGVPYKAWFIGKSRLSDIATYADCITTQIIARVTGKGFSWNAEKDKIAYISPDENEIYVNSVGIFPDIHTSRSLMQGMMGPYTGYSPEEIDEMTSVSSPYKIISDTFWQNPNACSFVVKSDTETSPRLVTVTGVNAIAPLGQIQSPIANSEIEYTSVTLENDYATSLVIYVDLKRYETYWEPPLDFDF